MKSWIDDLVNQHTELESPKAFWYWAGLAAISAIVKDNVWLEEGGAGWNVYPNIYVLLYADSGVGKGPPIALAHKLVKNVNNTKIISGRSSIQGILTRLSKSESRPGGHINKSSAGFIIASEFSSSLVHDPAAMDILTDLFDRLWRAGDWESLLKQEQFQLKDPTVSLLAGVNEAHFESLMESKDVFGGFIGRTFIINESKTHTLNPLILPLENEPNHEELTKHLKKLSLLHGNFEALGARQETDIYHIPLVTNNKTGWFTRAGATYQEWYMNFYHTVQEQDVQDPTGTIKRTRDAIKKVAMLLSLSHSTDLIIHQPQMEEAISICEMLIGNVRQTTLKKGRSPMAVNKGLIISELMKREDHRISRTVLAKKYWMHFTMGELDEMMGDFEVAGMVKMGHMGNQIIYEMPSTQVEEIRRRFEGKNN